MLVPTTRRVGSDHCQTSRAGCKAVPKTNNATRQDFSLLFARRPTALPCVLGDGIPCAEPCKLAAATPDKARCGIWYASKMPWHMQEQGVTENVALKIFAPPCSSAVLPEDDRSACLPASSSAMSVSSGDGLRTVYLETNMTLSSQEKNPQAEDLGNASSRSAASPGRRFLLPRGLFSRSIRALGRSLLQRQWGPSWKQYRTWAGGHRGVASRDGVMRVMDTLA